jgi:hypothetical protein
LALADGAMIFGVTKRLSDEEFWLLLTLLQRYADTDLDQWDCWQLDSRHSKVYLRIARELAEGESAQAFRTVQVPLAAGHRTGRFARTSAPAEVRSRGDLARVIAEMSRDLEETGQAEWENAKLGQFLEALSAILDDAQADRDSAQPTWATFASALIAATGYE